MSVARTNLHKTAVGGFSLVEVTIALAIVAFGIIALLGMLPTGLKLVRESSDEAAALNILMAVNSDLQSVADNATTTSLFQIPVGTVNSGKALFDLDGRWLGNGGSNPNAVYAATWSVRARTSNSPPTALVTVSWPAEAAVHSGSVEMLAVLTKDPGS